MRYMSTFYENIERKDSEDKKHIHVRMKDGEMWFIPLAYNDG